LIETIKALQESGGPPARLLTVDELAAELKISKFCVYDMSRQGKLPTHRIGKSLRFDLDEVLASQKRS
jgi:excisionase family DNA binding protein